jgi:hypothetical protein
MAERKAPDDEDVTVSAVIPKKMNDRLEAWRASSQLHHASRSAAIRALLEAGLDALAPVEPTPRAKAARS